MKRRALQFAIAIGIAVLLLTAVRSSMQHFIYPIPPVSVGAPPPGYAEVSWTLDDGTRVHGWHGGPTAGPVVVFFHGNGENLETLKWSGLFDRWGELGVYAVAVDYPGYGRSGGRPSEAGLVAGGLSALDWAKEALPNRPLVVAGWSLGAAVAMRVAADRPGAVDGLILMSAWTRLFDVATEHFPSFLVRLLLREEYDSVAAAARVGCPVLVVHGERDRIIPTRHGERLAEALGRRASWVPIDSAGHNDLLAELRVWETVRAFVDTVAPTPES